MSIAVLEAMAAGKPVVATSVGETPFIVEDGADGLLAQCRDVEGMAQAIARLVRDASLRQALGEAAARKVARQFTVQHMTAAYERLYAEIAARS